ncbi:MAG: hypothetical protein ACTS2F_16485 [Thainema sp.]
MAILDFGFGFVGEISERCDLRCGGKVRSRLGENAIADIWMMIGSAIADLN